jgi:hypothetical protein
MEAAVRLTIVAAIALGIGACGSSKSTPCVDGGNPLSMTSKPASDATLSSTDSPTFVVEDSPEPNPADAAMGPFAGIRVANWAPDAPPIDLCLARHSTGVYEGPVLGRLLPGQSNGPMVMDAEAPALSFPLVSAYVLTAPDQYDARLVAAGTGDCSTGAIQETQLPPLTVGQYATVALMGEVNPAQGAPGLKLVAFVDEPFPSGTIALRFINAAPAYSQVDFGSGVPGINFKLLFSGVPFGQTGAPLPDASTTSIDRLGYLSTGSLSGATYSVAASGDGGATLTSITGVYATAGAVITLAAVGATDVQLIESVDNAATVGLVASLANLPDH